MSDRDRFVWHADEIDAANRPTAETLRLLEEEKKRLGVPPRPDRD